MNPIMNKVINWLEAGAPHVGQLSGFDYSNWLRSDDCGTVACIAGAAVQFAAPDFEYSPKEASYRSKGHVHYTPHIPIEAQALLDLTDEETQLLFYPFELTNEGLIGTRYYDPDLDYNSEPLDWVRDLAPEQIAVVLRHFAQTGDINWYLADT